MVTSCCGFGVGVVIPALQLREELVKLQTITSAMAMKRMRTVETQLHEKMQQQQQQQEQMLLQQGQSPSRDIASPGPASASSPAECDPLPL
eukprot:1179071-Pyramimonas_sp.AAC.1